MGYETHFIEGIGVGPHKAPGWMLFALPISLSALLWLGIIGLVRLSL